MQKPYKSIQLFKNPFLERFTHVHPLTPLVVWVPVVVWMLYRSFAVHSLPCYAIGGLVASGVFVWTFCEYVTHRFAFHFHAEGKFQERIQFLIHGLHHADPVDPTRLVMPPAMSLLLGTVFFYLFRGMLGPELIDPFFAGFLMGYLCYDYIHFSVHHFTPRTKLGRMLKQHHMQHHFLTPNARWGVSSPVWDYVFGTVEEVKSIRHGS